MQEWLWQNDRNAMMHGIENRCPFLDPRLSRWLATPYATKFDGARNKPVLREAFRHFTPLAAAGRLPKQGFRFRYTRFIRQNAPALLDMVLSGAGTRRLLSPAGADQLLAAPTETLLSPIGQRLVVLAGLAEAGVVRLP
jgi:asparagine synthase (glutamine-hydrolysing)